MEAVATTLLMTLTPSSHVIILVVADTGFTARVTTTAILMMSVMLPTHHLAVPPIISIVLVRCQRLEIITSNCHHPRHQLAVIVTIPTNIANMFEETLHVITSRGHLLGAKLNPTDIKLAVDLAIIPIESVGQGRLKTGRAAITLILLRDILPMQSPTTVLTKIQTAVAILGHTEANMIHADPLVLESQATLLLDPQEPEPTRVEGKALTIAGRPQAATVVKKAPATPLDPTQSTRVAEATTTTATSTSRKAEVATIITRVTTVVGMTDTPETTTATIDTTQARFHHHLLRPQRFYQTTTKPSVSPPAHRPTRLR